MSELDKYYTKPEIVDLVLPSLPEFDVTFWIEPSAGAGVFSSKMPKCLAMDIAPEGPNILENDFLLFKTTDKVGVFGNPPFGKNSSLAIKFFNHAASFASVIAFIVPRTFKKVSVQNKLSLNWVLYKEIELPINAFTFEGKDYPVPCVWQIWIPGIRQKVVLPTTHPDFVWVDKSKADYAIRRVGGLSGKIFKEFDKYAESSNYFIQCIPEVYDKLVSLYPKFQEISKNTAGNPSLSKTELVQIYSDN